jgi:glutamate 5-kinase
VNGRSTARTRRYQRTTCNSGAKRAITVGGKSLLPIGLRRVDGDFAAGDVVALVDLSGTEFARGLSNYDADTARRVAGRKTEEVLELLGPDAYEEIIHRDNLTVLV